MASILLIDDDDALRTMLARLLERRGYEVHEAVDGEEGISLFNIKEPDIVITDLTNRVFPLIRYRLGDRGALLEERCACGNPLPRMMPPDGRTTDLIRLPSGAVLAHRRCQRRQR